MSTAFHSSYAIEAERRNMKTLLKITMVMMTFGLTLKMSADGPKVPLVCQDNFRFCIAGCAANDGACAQECFAEETNCIKVIHPS